MTKAKHPLLESALVVGHLRDVDDQQDLVITGPDVDATLVRACRPRRGVRKTEWFQLARRWRANVVRVENRVTSVDAAPRRLRDVERVARCAERVRARVDVSVGDARANLRRPV